MSYLTNFLPRTVFALAFTLLVSVGANTRLMADEVLTIGSVAPELDIEHWVQKGNGTLPTVTKFEKDKVYVVEFWATWCGPCIASMPHLSELQKKFASKGVQIISISDEELDKVESFLDRPVKKKSSAKDSAKDDDAKQTYRDLTSAYCLTTDPDMSNHKSYMEAAGQNGIPCAYIVGKDQKIEWIGHPMSMDDTLAAVVDGKWDRTAFAEKFKEQQVMDVLMGQISQYMQTGKTAKALSKINAALDEVKNADFKKQLKMMKVQISLSDKETPKELSSLVSEAYNEHADNPEFINFIAWTVYEKSEAGDLNYKELLKASRIAAEKAAEKATVSASKAAILDTVSHLQFIQGDIESALKTQEKAVELAEGDMKSELGEFLKTLKKAAK